MKRTLAILVLGLMCGLVAHVGWFSAHRPVGAADLGAQLAWMKTNLQLSDTQLARIRAVHEASAPQLLALASQVGSMREELQAFEGLRKSTGRVDFIEFAHFLEERRRLDGECVRSTERLVTAATEVMTPRQREKYLAWLSPALNGLRAMRVN